VSGWRSAGLWVAAAAVVSATGAARVPDHGMVRLATPTIAAHMPAATQPPSTQPGGNVIARVPVASFGPADGAPNTLVVDGTYPIVITVWVAATSGPAVIDAASSSGRLIGCAQRVVPAGVSRLRCTLVVAPTTAQRLNIAVEARMYDDGVVVSAYSHVLA
jgi:hypothetical protein